MSFRRGLTSVLLIAGLTAVSAVSQPPGVEGKLGKKQGKGPPSYELGKVLPPHIRFAVELTADQEKKLAELEKEVRTKLESILTEDQLKAIKSIPTPGAPPKGDFDRTAPMGKNGKSTTDPKTRPDAKSEPQPAPQANGGGIQFFGTLERGLAEAKRTNRPILFLSAAPHCGGISGLW